MPQTMPWMMPVRGNSDGVKDRHPAMSAPQQPGSVTYSSLLCFPGSGDGCSAISGCSPGSEPTGVPGVSTGCSSRP